MGAHTLRERERERERGRAREREATVGGWVTNRSNRGREMLLPWPAAGPTVASLLLANRLGAQRFPTKSPTQMMPIVLLRGGEFNSCVTISMDDRSQSVIWTPPTRTPEHIVEEDANMPKWTPH
ncbi:hypothetical protein GW17_00013157 [Ensete ventricosum]|nr:hypothetical protein GW17_00013157 [Ensete ventricosum]